MNGKPAITTVFIVLFFIVAVTSTVTIYMLLTREKQGPELPDNGVVRMKTSKTTDTTKSDFANTSGIGGDINDDGMVTSADIDMMSRASGCVSADPCWNEVVGKTLSGDNPIYTMDMDLNKDNAIDEADIAIARSNQQ